MTVPGKVAPANLVPAAAVIRGERVLYNQTGRKGSLGGKKKENGKFQMVTLAVHFNGFSRVF